MTRTEVQQRIIEVGLVPVVRASSGEQAVAAASAIRRGGVPIIEITMTVPGALEVIREVRQRFGGEVLVGGGTVLNAATALECLRAGAEFIVSPATDVDTIKAVRDAGKVAIPGALTPTEVALAWAAGADFVKIFPCGNVGGPKYIKALKAPFPDVRMVPTGGVSLATAAEFLAAGAAALGVGADLVNSQALCNGDLDVITTTARKFVAIIDEVRCGKAAAQV